MRRRLHLDFLRPYPRRTLLGAGLLVAGLATTTAVILEYRSAAAEASRLEASVADARRMARRELPRLRETGLDARALAEEVRNANVVLAQLTVPWDALFREIEQAGGEGVALLAIQPDAANGAVRIGGEARRFEDVLAYIGRLETRDALANVFLVSHELRQGGPRRPVAFTLVAQWTGGPASSNGADAKQARPR